MPHPLETAAHPEGPERVCDRAGQPRGRPRQVTLLLDEHRRVQQARLHIVEFRGFERFIQGRPYWEVPTLVQRLCGICPVSHLLAASKVCDPLSSARHAFPQQKSCADCCMPHRCCNRMPCTSSIWPRPTCSFGFDDAVPHRNIVGVLQDERELGLQGIRIRKFGQEVIRILTGKRYTAQALCQVGSTALCRWPIAMPCCMKCRRSSTGVLQP